MWNINEAPSGTVPHQERTQNDDRKDPKSPLLAHDTPHHTLSQPVSLNYHRCCTIASLASSRLSNQPNPRRNSGSAKRAALVCDAKIKKIDAAPSLLLNAPHLFPHLRVNKRCRATNRRTPRHDCKSEDYITRISVRFPLQKKAAGRLSSPPEGTRTLARGLDHSQSHWGRGNCPPIVPGRLVSPSCVCCRHPSSPENAEKILVRDGRTEEGAP